MSRTERIFDDVEMSPMAFDMDRNYLTNPENNKKNKKYDRLEEKSMAPQYVEAACCPQAGVYPCAWCCAGCNPLQCLVYCCCPT